MLTEEREHNPTIGLRDSLSLLGVCSLFFCQPNCHLSHLLSILFQKPQIEAQQVCPTRNLCTARCALAASHQLRSLVR